MRHKINLMFLFVFALGILSMTSFSYGAVPASERAALIALYNSTDGDNWNSNSGWKTPPLAADGFSMPGTEGTWYGISVSGDTVTAIAFDLNGLIGILPSELGNLSNLQTLKMWNNPLSGSIPAALGNLSHLTECDLSDNQLSGSLPAELGNLTNLSILAIRYNELSGSIPPHLGNLANLQTLDLTGNQLNDSIPAALGNLSHLKKLDLSMNLLSGSIPAALGDLSSLEVLYLFINQLSGSIPPELGNLSSLKWLKIFDNQLSGSIPAELGNLANLTDLDLSGNLLTGSIQVALGNLSKMNVLALGSNRLSGSIPAALGNLHDLAQLYLENNLLSGSIPAALGNLSNLGILYLYNNQLSGSIPAEFANLSSLNWLYLHNNLLSGAIPAGFGNFPDFWYLNLSNNQLTGSIPGDIGNSSSMFWLNLGNNHLSGPIPSNFPNLTNLSFLDIGYNCLSAADSTLRAWLDAKDSDWEAHQDQCTWPPIIILNKSHLYFGASTDGTVSVAQTVIIKNTGGGLLAWTATGDNSWLKVSPNAGTGPGVIAITVNPSGLSEGIYTGTITVSDPYAVNSPQAIAVTFEIYSTGSLTMPFGDFATPVNGSTVSGSIAVTGWALDDIEVKKVEIFNGEAYIGDAIFVEGARPDVESAYQQYPLNYKAGWGYMLLTNFLPGGGNGTYTLSARATDAEGNQVTLGSKTITCNNAQAVKPFGALDTPTQGGMASGYNFLNWGWVLTPQPNSIPTDGSTIEIWIDGLKKGHANYNVYREDIASLFPGYANSNGAVGYIYLDTTAYEDGIHTICWTAADSAGNSDGIGSRYFSIVNPDTSSLAAADKDTVDAADIALTSIKDFEYLPGFTASGQPLKITKGFGKISEACESGPISEENGITRVAIKELERIEMHFGENLPAVHGYMIIGNQLRRLPIGSTLDKRAGAFYWLPGPGFYGTYDLVFLIKDSEGQWYKEMVEITIEPRFRGNE
ncbi:MAG: Ig-like domain-containing protein [Candidatus Aminicenantes bacterium]|nr:Ig-like domain-containing protein [Candidatus Aminicenantes bacterium]